MTKEQLMKIMPSLHEDKADLYFEPLQEAMNKYEINTLLREAAFLAQLGHESLDLKYMEEIASGSAYEGRVDLGNINPGDGARYKGRGPIQLTGRANYKRYGDLLGIDLEDNPEQASTPEVGFQIAGLFWSLRKLNTFADQENMKEITHRINGGYNGLDDRLKRYEVAKQVLST